MTWPLWWGASQRVHWLRSLLAGTLMPPGLWYDLQQKATLTEGRLTKMLAIWPGAVVIGALALLVGSLWWFF